MMAVALENGGLVTVQVTPCLLAVRHILLKVASSCKSAEESGSISFVIQGAVIPKSFAALGIAQSPAILCFLTAALAVSEGMKIYKDNNEYFYPYLGILILITLIIIWVITKQGKTKIEKRT